MFSAYSTGNLTKPQLDCFGFHLFCETVLQGSVSCGSTKMARLWSGKHKQSAKSRRVLFFFAAPETDSGKLEC